MNPRVRVVFGIALALAAPGCVKKDYPADSPVIDDVALSGADAVNASDVMEGLATAPSPRFLGIWDGVVFDYEVFDEALLSRDLERIERYYRARGYYEAKVTAARVVHTDNHHVRVELRVHEGQPVFIRGLTTAGVESIDFEAAAAVMQAVPPRIGARFDEADYERSKKAIVTTLANKGYAFAKVLGKVTVDVARHTADVRFEVTPGNRAVFGPVRIVGLRDVPEAPVRANLDIHQGKPYSRAELDDAKTALVNLGVFATVDVQQDLSHPESGVVPVAVMVTEAPLRTLKMGGGMRFDVLEWSSNLTIGWEHRNFLGGMRKFSIETKPGVVFFPTRIDDFEAPKNVLPRNRVRAELRQPAFIEGRTTGFLATEFNVYPVLYPEQTSHDPVIGYEEVKAQAGVERAFFGHHLYVTPSYNWQANVPFAYLGPKADIDTVYISYPDLTFMVDFRDDPIEPHQGAFFSNTLQVAGHGFGGDASDVKEQPEIRTYVPISKTVTFATRATIGFLFPSNYGDTLQEPPPVPPTHDSLRDQQILLLRAFYSGGPNSNRGYPFRGVGPHGILGFLAPSTAGCSLYIPNTDPTCQRPVGGLTLWEASAEVRFPLFGPLRAALFIDASDVSRGIADIRLNYPHLSPGFGLRYATPVGPVRLDIGYRVPFAQEVGTQVLSYKEGGEPSTILGLPIAIHFGLGEAF